MIQKGTALIWIGKLTSAQCMKNGLGPAGDLTVEIMKNGRCGWTMRKGLLITS